MTKTKENVSTEQCVFCKQLFPIGLLEKYTVRGNEIFACSECLKDFVNQIITIAKPILPKLINEAKELEKKFPEGSKVQIKGGSYGVVGEICEVLGVKVAYENGWHVFIMINTSKGPLLKYPQNIELVSQTSS